MYSSRIEQSPTWHRLSGALWGRFSSSSEVIGTNYADDADEKSAVEFEYTTNISKSAADFYNLGLEIEQNLESNILILGVYKKVLSIDKKHFYATFKIGEFYYKINKSYAEALTYFQEILPYFEHITKISTDLAIAFLVLCNCQEHIGNNEAAIASCQLAFEIDPSLVEGDSLYAYHISHALKTNALMAVYDSIIEKNPKSVSGYHERGLLKFQLEDISGGVKDLRKSKELSDSIRE